MTWVGYVPALELMDGDRRRCDPLDANDVGPPGSSPGSGSRQGTRRSSRSSCPTTRPTGSRRPAYWSRAGGGKLRVSFHLSTAEADVDRALDALFTH
jgi:selenocysteine lyase/cysteine desulfurase